MPLSVDLGYILLALSALANGSAFVPLKLARQRCLTLDDSLFQAFWGLGAVAVMVATIPVNCHISPTCFSLAPLGFAAGAAVFAATVAVFVAVRHLDGVRQRIEDLRALERTLAAAADACALGDSPDCPVIDALTSNETSCAGD